MKVYNHEQKLTFQISGGNGVNPDRANPLIKMLRETLQDFKVKEDNLVASVQDLEGVTEFYAEQINANLIQGGFTVAWHICDFGSQEYSSYRWNNTIRNKLANHLSQIKLSRYCTFLKIVKVNYH